MDCANVTKIPTPPSAKRFLPSPPLTNMRCTKAIPRVREWRAVSGPYVGISTNIALEAEARPTQDRCSIVVRLTEARSSMPLGAIAVISDTLFSELYEMRVFSFYFFAINCQRKVQRGVQLCISAFR